MPFCTAVNCIDGRVQLPVISYLKDRFNVSYVDIVSEAGPNRFLSEQRDSEATKSILRRVDISIKAHKSKGVAIVAHYDCAGNPVNEEKQHDQLRAAVEYLGERYPHLDVIGLWVNDAWSVNEICSIKPSES